MSRDKAKSMFKNMETKWTEDVMKDYTDIIYDEMDERIDSYTGGEVEVKNQPGEYNQSRSPGWYKNMYQNTVIFELKSSATLGLPGKDTKLIVKTSIPAGPWDESLVTQETVSASGTFFKRSGVSSWSNWEESANKEDLFKIKYYDTRNDDKDPVWYFRNYPRQVVHEFKKQSTINLPSIANGTYAAVTTHVSWSNKSGGPVSQIAIDYKNNVFIRNGSDSNWSSWKPIKYDSGWKNLKLLNGVYTGDYAGVPQIRRIDNQVYVRGSLRNFGNARNVHVATLDSQFRPKDDIYWFAPTGGRNMVRMYVKKENGRLHIEWRISLYDVSYIGDNNWIDINHSWMVD